MEETIYFKEENNQLFIQAVGHMTASISAALRNKVIHRLSVPPAVTRFYVDLSLCEYMDSTFMGLLVGFNKRFEKLTGKKIELPCPSRACYDLLSNLGVHTFLNIEDNPVDLPQGMENLSRTDTPTTEFILKTHENLIEISEENRRKFETLHNILKQKLEEEENL